MATLTNRAGSATLSGGSDDIELTNAAGLIILIPDEGNTNPLNVSCPLLWGDGVTYPAAPGEKIELNSPSTKLMSITVSGTGSYRYRTVSPELQKRLRS